MKILLINKFLHPVGGDRNRFFSGKRVVGTKRGMRSFCLGWRILTMWHMPMLSIVCHRWILPSPVIAATCEIWCGHGWRVERLNKADCFDTKPDVAHLHNIYHQLSPSIIQVLNGANVPAFLTLHDYKLVCPNYKLFTDGAPCTRCVAGSPWQAMRHKCLKELAP